MEGHLSDQSYRAALIGVGMVSGTFVNALANLPVQLTGALGARSGSAAAFLERHKLPGRAYGSVAEIAADESVDFVILTTPPDSRVEIVQALAAAGKPILMEKPIERSLMAARRICEICEAEGVPLGIVLQHRASDPAQELLRQKSEFGDLRVVEIHVPWWRDQAYYDEPGRGSYARDGGGVLLTQAIHVIDLALQFTGKVSDVVAMCATSGFHRMEAEDFVSAGLRFENGAVGSLMASTASFPGRSEEIVLHYAKASVRLQRGRLQVQWQDGRTEEGGKTEASGAGADPMAFSSELHRRMIADFAACLDNGAQPMASGRSALGVHALIEAIEAGGRSGERVGVVDV